MSKSALDLLLLSSEIGTITSDGAGNALREEERLRVLILALAIWDIAARFVRCVASLLNAATNVVLSNFYVQQLEKGLQDTSNAALKIAARQEVCRKRCIASRAPSQSLLLSQQASQFTVRQAMPWPPCRSQLPDHRLHFTSSRLLAEACGQATFVSLPKCPRMWPVKEPIMDSHRAFK